MGYNDIPKDPAENIKRLESIRAAWTNTLQHKEEELKRKRAQLDTAQNGVHQELLQRRVDQLVEESTELAGKIQWTFDQVERIRDKMASGGYELTHRPFAAALDDDVHLDGEG